jgi:hypothetical protein
LKGKRDSQRGRVYAWENRVIAPRDSTLIAYGRAQAMVDAIWLEMGLKYPPRVEPLPRQSSATLASATRLSIFMSEAIPSWCLLHELAHAMTSTAEGDSDRHGPIFMGVYLKLISRYLRVGRDELFRSAAGERIEITPDANPIFVEARRPTGINNEAAIARRAISLCQMKRV